MIDVKTSCGSRPVRAISTEDSLDKAVNARLNVEVDERKAADAFLQEEINEIVSGGSATISVNQEADGSVVLSLKNKAGEIVSSGTITETSKIIKSAELNVATKKIILTCLDNSTIDCDVSYFIDNYYTSSQTDSLLAGKADLVNGKVPASELPSYVDDVLEFPTFDDFPEIGESGKIYVALDTGHTFRWSGSEYVEIGGGLEIIPVSDSTTLLEIPDGFSILQYNVDSFFISNKVTNQLTRRVILSLQNHDGVYSAGNLRGTDTIEEFLIENNYSPYTMTYIDEDEIPENEKGLYRYIEEGEDANISSHIIEVVKEAHSGGSISYTKTTTTNGQQITTGAAFLSHFNQELSSYVSISSLTNIYSFYYNNEYVSRNGIRIGTKNTGRLVLTLSQAGSITFGKNFSYNGQTHVVTYDAGSKVIIDGIEHTFSPSEPEGTITIELDAGEHTITSNGQDIEGGSTQGRIVLISFNFVGEPYDTFIKHKLARVGEVEDLANTVEDYKEEIDNTFETVQTSIEDLGEEIVNVDNKIGEVQIDDVANLPSPSDKFLNKLFRCNEKLYECVKRGDGVHKEFIFDVGGTSEVIYGNEGKSYEAFMKDVGNEFEVYYEIPLTEDKGQTVLDIGKVFRNNDTIRIGSSSATGYFRLQSIVDEPITSLRIGFKAYRDDRPSAIYIEDDYGYVNEVLLNSSEKESLINIPYQSDTNLSYIYLETMPSYMQESGESGEPILIQCDKRVVVTRLIADFGEVYYEWIPISSIDSLAYKYDSSSEYNVGNVVVYDDTLYECVEDVSTPEEFDPSKWTDVTVSELLDEKASLTGNNTFTGTNTFYEVDLASSQSNVVWKIENDQWGEVSFKRNATDILKLLNGSVWAKKLIPLSNAESLGDVNNKWTDGYFSGNVYAQNTFNIINASDISGGTTFSADQITLLRNGKETKIIGDFLGIANPTILSFMANNESTPTWYRGLIVGSNRSLTRFPQGLSYVATLFVNSSGVANITNDPTVCFDSAIVKQIACELINKNTNGFGLTLPDTSGFTADSEIVDTRSAQSIKGIKTTKEIRFVNNVDNPTGSTLAIQNDNGYNAKIRFGNANNGFMFTGSAPGPIVNGQIDFGSSGYRWKDLYLAGSIDFGDNATINKDSSNRINLNYNSNAKVKVGSAETTFKNRVGADSDNTYDIGRDTVRWKDAYIAGNLSDGTNSINIANIVGIKEDFSSQISLDNESSLTILRKECVLVKHGDSVKMHIYISGKNESGAQVSNVRFSSNSSFTISNSAIADAIKDMNGNAISSATTGQVKAIIQKWYNDRNTTVQALRLQHTTANGLYLYSAGYAVNIPDNANFIVSIDEDLAF